MNSSSLMLAMTAAFVITGAAASSPPAVQQPIACEPIRVSGEVNRGESFEKRFGPGLVFWLRPETHPNNPPGWTVVVRSVAEPEGTRDYAMVATPPYRFWNPRYVNTSYGLSAEAAVSMTPRMFNFVLAESDYSLMHGALGKLLWSGNYSQEEIAQAKRIAEEVGDRAASGVFTILDSRLGSAGPEDKTGWIEWMKFKVDLCQAETPSADDRRLTEQDLYPLMEEKFLRETVDPCETEKKLTITRIQYGELDTRPGEEALVEALSCLAGTGGIDLFGVWTVAGDGSIRELPIVDGLSTGTFEGRDIRAALRGKMSLAVENGRLLQRFPVYQEEDSNCCPSGGERHLIYRFEDGKFALDRVVDVPPEQE